MCDVARDQLFWSKLIISIPVVHKAFSIGRHTIEMQVRKRLKTFRLLIISGRVWVVARKPAPRAVCLIGLAAIYDDGWFGLAQRLHDAPPSPPLRIGTSAWDIQERVIEGEPGNSSPALEYKQTMNQEVLERSG